MTANTVDPQMATAIQAVVLLLVCVVLLARFTRGGRS